MTKTLIVLFSDPTHGGEEALGRLFNAMFLTLELKEKHQHVELLFQGDRLGTDEFLEHPISPF